MRSLPMPCPNRWRFRDETLALEFGHVVVRPAVAKRRGGRGERRPTLIEEATLANAQETVLELFYGRWRSQTLYAGVKLGIFEVLESAPKHAAQIARELGLDPALAYRLLRALKSLGVLQEHDPQAFTVTAAGELLRSDHPQSMRDAFLLREGPEHTAVWKHLAAIVRDGTQNGFVREYGTSAFDHAARVPSYGKAFDAGMSSQSNLQTSWTIEALRRCDFAAVAHLCDVGGGHGHLLCHLLVRYPHLVGTVLDRSSVLDQEQELWAGKLHVNERCTYLAGDMFVDVPAADAYTMKMILHDWNDDECVQILSNLHRRAARAGRIFIIEHVIPDTGRPDYAAMFDMHMMCWGTGRERTVQEYRHLLQTSGWEFAATWFPPNGAIGVVEGAKSG